MQRKNVSGCQWSIKKLNAIGEQIMSSNTATALEMDYVAPAMLFMASQIEALMTLPHEVGIEILVDSITDTVELEPPGVGYLSPLVPLYESLAHLLRLSSQGESALRMYEYVGSTYINRASVWLGLARTSADIGAWQSSLARWCVSSDTPWCVQDESAMQLRITQTL